YLHINSAEDIVDATIACQGRYFPVHRVVLSTCSDYFDEMFERMQCQHPTYGLKTLSPRNGAAIKLHVPRRGECCARDAAHPH
ncbi:UNVERIFIED_CONTAM: hypothetical protein GTU68_063252, partial [Idotea baltica]|nr:hypothetical protein [Idotea baltica]